MMESSLSSRSQRRRPISGVIEGAPYAPVASAVRGTDSLDRRTTERLAVARFARNARREYQQSTVDYWSIADWRSPVKRSHRGTESLTIGPYFAILFLSTVGCPGARMLGTPWANHQVGPSGSGPHRMCLCGEADPRTARRRASPERPERRRWTPESTSRRRPEVPTRSSWTWGGQ